MEAERIKTEILNYEKEREQTSFRLNEVKNQIDLLDQIIEGKKRLLAALELSKTANLVDAVKNTGIKAPESVDVKYW